MEEDISCCGLDCSRCDLFGSVCFGCNKSCGKVFHAPKGGECPIYYCSRIKNRFKSCGECEKLPCDIILETRDPSLTEEEFLKTVEDRVSKLKEKIKND